jgi:DNA-binding response OmpR family regulator
LARRIAHAISGAAPEHPRWIETVWGIGYRFAA